MFDPQKSSHACAEAPPGSNCCDLLTRNNLATEQPVTVTLDQTPAPPGPMWKLPRARYRVCV